MDFVDFHTHLDWYSDEQDLFLQLKNFCGTIVAASVCESSYKKNISIAQKQGVAGAKILATFGIHPKEVPNVSENLCIYDDLCKSSKIIGEIGMDFCWYKDASEAKQEKVFRYFLNHCNEEKKYCVIHTKDAEKQICDILSDYPNAKPIIHWYDGPEKIYDEFIRRGYFQTFGCETVRSKHIQNLLKKTPYELILAETDNPTAEPWLGGSDNSVNLIKRVYSDIATVLGISTEKCGEIINRNSKNIFDNL